MRAYKTVKDMYSYASANNIKLLSEGGNAVLDPLWTFWGEYTANSATYDKLFTRIYKSFRYFDQDGSETISDLVTAFVADVKATLTVNRKKYAELYRVHVLPDADYSLVNNYDMTETMDKTNTRNLTDAIGSSGGTTETEIAGFNSSGYEDASKATSVTNSRTDQYTGTEDEDYTFTRKGNIGVMTVTDMLGKHIELWDSYKFYTMIFTDICKDLLMVGGE